MANIAFPPISGVAGLITIDSYDYPLSSWEYDSKRTSIPLSTACSMPWSDQRKGATSLTIRASGICRSTFNPFRTPAADAHKPYLGTYHRIVLKVLDSNTFANCPSALITQWLYRDTDDGVATWSMTAEGNFKFQNMGGQNNK